MATEVIIAWFTANGWDEATRVYHTDNRIHAVKMLITEIGGDERLRELAYIKTRTVEKKHL